MIKIKNVFNRIFLSLAVTVVSLSQNSLYGIVVSDKIHLRNQLLSISNEEKEGRVLKMLEPDFDRFRPIFLSRFILIVDKIICFQPFRFKT